MIRAALLALPLATPALAQDVRCTLTPPCRGTACAPVQVAFTIDRNQFVAPMHPNEPPRRKITHVEMGRDRFAAEPFLIGPALGFWEDAEAVGSRMLVVQPGGDAKYSETPSGRRLTGTCEVSD